MDSLCAKCPAMCCRYIALAFDNPETRQAFEEVRWFLMHEGVSVFVAAGQWYVSIASPCKHLSVDGKCLTYPTRPKICRAYSDKNCDYHGGDYNYSMFFSHPEQVEEYAEKFLKKHAKPARKRKKAAKPGKKSARQKRMPARPRRKTKKAK